MFGRREGDIKIFTGDWSLASKELNWKPIKNVEEMCKKIQLNGVAFWNLFKM